MAIRNLLSFHSDKDEAIEELKEGGFGFHEIWKNLPSWIADLDIEAIRKEVGITNALTTTSKTQ